MRNFEGTSEVLLTLVLGQADLRNRRLHPLQDIRSELDTLVVHGFKRTLRNQLSLVESSLAALRSMQRNWHDQRVTGQFQLRESGTEHVA